MKCTPTVKVGGKSEERVFWVAGRSREGREEKKKKKRKKKKKKQVFFLGARSENWWIGLK
jgi:hypothetical protein